MLDTPHTGCRRQASNWMRMCDKHNYISHTHRAASLTLCTVLLSIQALLQVAEPDDPQDAVVARQYKEGPELYRKLPDIGHNSMLVVSSLPIFLMSSTSLPSPTIPP